MTWKKFLRNSVIFTLLFTFSSVCSVYGGQEEAFYPGAEQEGVKQELEQYLEDSYSEYTSFIDENGTAIDLLAEEEQPPLGNFDLKNAYWVNVFREPDFVKVYEKTGELSSLITDKNGYWVIPTDTGYKAYAGESGSGFAYEGLAYPMNPEAVALAGEKDITKRAILEEVLQQEGLENSVYDSCFVESGVYRTTFYYCKNNEGEELLIPYGSRPDFTGLVNGKVYRVPEVTEILQQTMPQSETENWTNGGGGGNGQDTAGAPGSMRPSFPLSKVLLCTAGIALVLIGTYFLRKKIKQQ